MKEEKKRRRKPRFNPRGQTELEEFLGVPPPHEQPFPGARKVPNTCHEWY